MSHSHIGAATPNRRLPPRLWPLWVVAIASGIMLAFFAAGRISDSRVDVSHLTTEGSILESKIVMDYSLDSPYGGRIFYRIDARVSYEIDGKTYDRWMQASEVSTARDLLQAKLAHDPRKCQVYWAEGHPDNARCRI